MPGTHRQLIGSKSEQKAQRFLEDQGFCLIERNYQCYHGEIDLVMQDKSEIVFVEVRSRSCTTYGSALESINQFKIKKLYKTATHFLQKNGWLHQVNSRFDVIAIDFIKNEAKLEWVKNAF